MDLFKIFEFLKTLIFLKKKKLKIFRMSRSIHCSSPELKVIKNLRQEGKSIREIAKLINRSANMILNALKPKTSIEKRGRPRATSKTTDHRIVQLSKKDPFMTSNEILSQINDNVSARTVRRRLQDSGLFGRSPRKVLLLSSKNIRNF